MTPTQRGQDGAGFLANLKTNPTISYSIKLYLSLQLKNGSLWVVNHSGGSGQYGNLVIEDFDQLSASKIGG